MLDLSALDTLTDRQLSIRLIALLTSLVQHRDRSPSSTVCRNGDTCSYRPNCWLSHAIPPPEFTVRRAGTARSAQSSASSQRSATTWRTPRPGRALATPPPPCFSGRNAFGSLAPRRRRRHSPGIRRLSAIHHDAPLPPPPASSSPAPCQRRRRRRRNHDIDDISYAEILRIATTLPRRRPSFDSVTPTETSSSPRRQRSPSPQTSRST